MEPRQVGVASAESMQHTLSKARPQQALRASQGFSGRWLSEEMAGSRYRPCWVLRSVVLVLVLSLSMNKSRVAGSALQEC